MLPASSQNPRKGMDPNILERILDRHQKPCSLELALLRTITEDFSDDQIIGKGGCGIVYMGSLKNNRSVAVKKLLQAHTIDEKMFDHEVRSMMMAEHDNIVRLLGFCAETKLEPVEQDGKYILAEVRERLLCFEYISKGGLDKHLKDELKGLEWSERYKIIKGICDGLHHLHNKKIRHMDLKPANILLGDHMIPKITDFGLARLDEKSQTTNKQRLLSPGYCAPEYQNHGNISAKSDIYSLGVIIIELVTGRKMKDTNITEALRRWRHRWNKSSEHTPLLWYRQVVKCLDLAQWCKRENPIDRPWIHDIICELNKIDHWDGKIRYATVSTFDEIMSSLEDMLRIEPLELHFPFALNKQIPCSIELSNDTDDYFVFRIATTSLLPFGTQPGKGIVPPRSKCCATITLQAQEKELLHDHWNKEFTVQSYRVDASHASMDVMGEMFDVGKAVDQVNLAVVFDMPPTPEAASGEPHLNANDESLGPSSQVDPRSQELIAPTVPEDSWYMGVHVLERILDGSEHPRILAMSLLRLITENFSRDRIIGSGGHGTVYKGTLQNGIVAVKRLYDTYTKDDRMFYEEVRCLVMVRHKNIEQFLGYSVDTQGKVIEVEGRYVMVAIQERLLCFEYISNGSLEQHLNDELRGHEWHTRYQIIKGICEALHYLHKEKHIIHMDLKPSNILLDDHMVPKVTKFGLSRLDENPQTKSSERMFSLGYCAPEFQFDGCISAKSDIYSLGVVIMELVTGTKEKPDITKVIRRWRHRWNKSGKYTPVWEQQVSTCLELALCCVRKDPIRRPHIGDVIRKLNDCELVNTCIDDMLGIEPLELHISFELNKPLSCSVELTNGTHHYMAFCMETSSSLPLRAKPDKNILPPGSKCTVSITLLPLEEVPYRRHYTDGFSVWSTRVEEGVSAMDITKDLFNEEPGKVVDKVNLNVTFDMPQSLDGA